MFALISLAAAADLHVELATEGDKASASWDALDAASKKFGPFAVGRSSVVYTITIPTGIYLSDQNGYLLEVGTCLEWSRKGKSDRYCTKDEIVAPVEAAGPAKLPGSIKAKDKFEWTLSVWYTPSPEAAPAL